MLQTECVSFTSNWLSAETSIVRITALKNRDSTEKQNKINSILPVARRNLSQIVIAFINVLIFWQLPAVTMFTIAPWLLCSKLPRRYNAMRIHSWLSNYQLSVCMCVWVRNTIQWIRSTAMCSENECVRLHASILCQNLF